MLTMKDIIREGHPTLRLKAKEVKIPLNKEDKNTLKLMMEFIENSIDPVISEEYELRAGVGIAAPQIDVSKQMIAVKTMDELNETEHTYLMVNPKIIGHSIKQTYIDTGEGCLSVDRDVEGIVPRHQKVTVRSYFYDKDTEELTKGVIKLKGYVGVVVQHEIDHINGILFVDKLVDDLPEATPVKFADLTFEETEL